MKAIAIVPGRPETAGVIDMPEPRDSDGSVLVQTRSIGLCGTDLEIALEGYGVPPPGEKRLVLVHESLGEVIEAPEGERLRVWKSSGRHCAAAGSVTMPGLRSRRVGYVSKRGLR